jgi:Glycosyl hydrolases family 28
MNAQKKTLLLIITQFLMIFLIAQPITIVLVPATDTGLLMSATIQRAIDSCGSKGGGTVRLSAGTYLSGTLFMRSKVRLQLDKSALLKGSANYADYTHDAFIYGEDISAMGIEGEGTIDGVDCVNKNGEEGFRGPHAIRLVRCSNILLQQFTIINAANWAINCRYCTDANVKKITILGGHDGLHTRFCSRFTVTDCHFKTGDDAFAGNDNRDFVVTGCEVNTSCTGFRMGCLNLQVKHCRIWGPGVYVHRIENAVRMPTAFAHFSPKDESPKLPSGNWLIQDCVIEGADYVYIYNYANGLWQTGQPATNLRFERIKASGLLRSFYIVGDSKKQFSLFIDSSTFRFREGATAVPQKFEGVELLSTAFFYAKQFNKIDIRHSKFEKGAGKKLFEQRNGNYFSWNNRSNR